MFNTPMKLSQNVRFFAPEYIIKSINVEQRLFNGKPDKRALLFTGELESAGPGGLLEASAVEEFANCLPSEAAVKKFVRRFGPLETTTDGKEFGFSLEGWIGRRQVFRRTWDQLLGLAARQQDIGPLPPELAGFKEILLRKPEPCRKVETQGTFELTNVGIVYVADSVYTALVLKLFALHAEKRLRRCLKPECNQQPYFIAIHARQKYCSDICAQWAQARWKTEWWHTKGSRWLQDRPATRKLESRKRNKPSSQKRGTKHGTQKTR